MNFICTALTSAFCETWFGATCIFSTQFAVMSASQWNNKNKNGHGEKNTGRKMHPSLAFQMAAAVAGGLQPVIANWETSNSLSSLNASTKQCIRVTQQTETNWKQSSGHKRTIWSASSSEHGKTNVKLEPCTWECKLLPTDCQSCQSWNFKTDWATCPSVVSTHESFVISSNSLSFQMGLALMHDPSMLFPEIHDISQCNPLLKIDPSMLPFCWPSCSTSFKSHCLAHLTGFAAVSLSTKCKMFKWETLNWWVEPVQN